MGSNLLLIFFVYMWTMISDHNACIVMTAYPNEGKELRKMIMGILKQNLATCVQRLNYMKSYYIREGKLTKREEKLLLIKTTDEKKEKLIAFVKKMHPYKTPEIMVLRPDEVDDSYLWWMNWEEKESSI